MKQIGAPGDHKVEKIFPWQLGGPILFSCRTKMFLMATFNSKNVFWVEQIPQKLCGQNFVVEMFLVVQKKKITIPQKFCGQNISRESW